MTDPPLCNSKLGFETDKRKHLQEAYPAGFYHANFLPCTTGSGRRFSPILSEEHSHLGLRVFIPSVELELAELSWHDRCGSCLPPDLFLGPATRGLQMIHSVARDIVKLLPEEKCLGIPT